MTKIKSGRASSAKSRPVIDLPDLIEIQKNSYEKFLQENVLPEKRVNDGLETVFIEVFPISSYDEKSVLEYVAYTIGVPKYNVLECQRRGLTYSVPLNVIFRLRTEKNIKEETVYMGNIPKMTLTGTFIINGAERVIVSQLHRSPGICFEQEVLPGGISLPYARIIPYRGSWMEAQFDVNDLIYIYLDRLRRRKILATTFLRALGFSKNEDILSQFYEIEEIAVNKKLNVASLLDRILAADVIDPVSNSLHEKAGTKITKAFLEKIKIIGMKSIKILKHASWDDPFIKMLRKDSTDSKENALKEIYKKLRPGDPPTIANASALIKRLFFDPRRYDLGKVGRFKLNQKLGLPMTEEELHVTTLKRRDIIEAIRYLLQIYNGDGLVDDIDHLGNRRVRSVGELVQNQCRIGLARMERVIKERMNLYDFDTEIITPHKLINPKSFSSVIKDFFGRSQLSQFMDQTNPLAELTHKRRLSALGPGGLSRERAGFEVRDVHPSHYGRMCPIETPEGPNIGLIASLSTYAKVNQYGFIETPYRKVGKGHVTNKIEYLTADEEERHVIAQANAKADEKGKLLGETVSVRYKNEALRLSPEKVEYMDVSPVQLVSVAAGLIPFLEHDDANRALMGSNMQRQAVPLMDTEEALVSTGLEERAARDSGVLVIAEEDGVVEHVDGTKIVIGDNRYKLRKFLRSNAGTTVNQRPIVSKGQKIKKGDVIADSMATKDGRLSLGRNVLVAFMPWEGYNFEDAIVISERLLKEDIYTSLHIEDFEIGARDTKLGKEEITRDIPGLGEDVLRNLDEGGIVYEGAEVKPNDVLVGKITPKSETELSPEERLLRAIFGEKAADVRAACLEVPSGTEGIVIDVKSFSRRDKSRSDEERIKERQHIKEINEEFKKRAVALRETEFVKIRDLLIGKKLPVDIIDGGTGEIVIPAKKKITEEKLRNLEAHNYEHIEMEECSEREKIREILWNYNYKMEVLETNHSLELEKVKKGDELEPGVIKKVKVYIATKRKLSVGDKMAGRHGNKGVIAKIVPEEDMPFLEDGTPVDMILNPLGVPSRMNVGQVLETHLGWAAEKLGLHLETPVFEGIKEEEIKKLLKEARLPETGKTRLYDGRTGKPFDQEIAIGNIYIMKLAHIAADKIHARATGPYSLVTQQPLGGKAQFGGQRFGEMEVWALEAYGAAYTLQEILTVKSDDVIGRTKMYESIVKGQNVLEAGIPESFNVLVKEIQSLALDIRPERE